MARWLKEWPAFEAAMQERLREGYKQYGDWSYDRPIDTKEGLLRMVEEEVMDIVGWSFILWVRLRDLARAAEGGDIEGREE